MPLNNNLVIRFAFEQASVPLRSRKDYKPDAAGHLALRANGKLSRSTYKSCRCVPHSPKSRKAKAFEMILTYMNLITSPPSLALGSLKAIFGMIPLIHMHQFFVMWCPQISIKC